MIDVSAAAALLRLNADDDALVVQGMIDAAIQRASDWLDRPLFQAGQMPDPAPEGALEINPAIERAVLILVALDYDKRHGGDDRTDLGLPPQVHSILSPYRRFGPIT